MKVDYMGKKKGERYTIAVDFDGVLHSYTTPWSAPHIIPDPPVPGALHWLTVMSLRFDIVIFTARGRTWRGRRAIRRWLYEHTKLGNMGRAEWEDQHPLGGLKIVSKPTALVYIDDRAWRFVGTNFPSPNEVHRALPWMKRAARPPSSTPSESKDALTRVDIAELRDKAQAVYAEWLNTGEALGYDEIHRNVLTALDELTRLRARADAEDRYLKTVLGLFDSAPPKHDPSLWVEELS